jgi:hypothetical protein
VAALVAILLGMALVYRFFPKREAELALHEGYLTADRVPTPDPPARMPLPADA